MPSIVVMKSSRARDPAERTGCSRPIAFARSSGQDACIRAIEGRTGSMKPRILLCFAPAFVAAVLALSASDRATARTDEIKGRVSLSDASEACLSCHSVYTPGIVRDWQRSLHARTTVRQALTKPQQERRVSVAGPEDVRGLSADVAVGCAECHLLDPDAHGDTFEHQGYRVHVVVSPSDCGRCHPVEQTEYRERNKMSRAHENLAGNRFYQSLMESVLARPKVAGSSLSASPATPEARMESCYGCHGTRVSVRGFKKIQTPLEPILVPDLAGWPNTAVGRVNPDGTSGSCSSCHARHHFSVSIARRPGTCSKCHLEPDAPAWNVYTHSKHGILSSAQEGATDFDAIPWALGKDFHAPTCAACHASLIVDGEGARLAARTHGYGDRLWVRLFGLIYSHPQPAQPDTTAIRNRDGQPLPITLDGEAADAFLIDVAEQERRRRDMQTLCQGCHGTQWVTLHFEKLAVTIREADDRVRQATALMERAWTEGRASRENLFDEPVEILWAEQWLFHANAVRYTSAMAGSPDFAAFHGGYWALSRGLLELKAAVEGERRIR